MVFLHYYNKKDIGDAPIISFKQERIEISVKEKQDALLNGVEAYDKEDGDLSSEVIVESLSAFDENKDRIVTYAVFDSDRHVTKATRKIHYTDYEKPKIYLNDAFISNELSVPGINALIGATSSVDGDISSKILVEMQTYAGKNDINVNVQAKDSTGETENLDLIYNYDRNIYTTDIVLKKYLVYINVGEEFNADKNIKEIKTRSVRENPKQYLDIENQVNNQVPGIYEVTYSFSNLGDNGLTKCIVVVEKQRGME